MLRKHPIGILFGATALCASSVIFVPIAVALPEDADQPIHIRADNAEIDQQQGLAIYRGDVRVEQGTLRVTADEMTVEYVDQKVVRVTAKGNPAHYRQQIKAGQEQVIAHSSVIIYFTQEERLDLMGDALLIQGGSEITGDLIKYDIVAGKVDATAQNDERIRMVLQPAASNTTSNDSDGG